ncbi:hypothetical protein Emed_002609 [Eimeria media]
MRLRITEAASCILLGLCMHLLYCTPLCLLAGGAVVDSASEFFAPWDATADLLSENVDTFTVSDEQTLRDAENTDLRVLLSNSDVIEISAQLEDEVTQANTEDARKNPRTLSSEQKPSGTSRFLTRFCLSVFLALCLCFLAVHGKEFPTSQATKKSRIQRTRGLDDELSSRLKALRASIPVADQLGTAVNTAEARELLQEVHANVPKEGEGDGKAGTIREASIANAFSAMRGLQQAAVKEAGSILQENFDNLSSVSSFLKGWEKAYLGEKEAGELSPLVTALRLSQNHFLEVSQQMQEVYEMLEQAQSFEDKQVMNSLLSTTDSFNFISKLQEDRESAATLALEQHKMAEAAMRMALSRKTTRGFRQRWGELEIAQAYVNIAREAGAAVAAEGESAESVAEVRGHLDEAEVRLTKYEEELKGLTDYSRSEAHDSISDTLARNITLELEQESLRASLENYWVIFKNHVKMPGKLEDSGRESVKSVLRQALQRISQDRDTMDVAITSILSRMAQVFGDREMNNRLSLSEKENHDILHRRMTAEMLNFLGRAEGRMIQLESSLQSLDQEEDTKAAAETMENAAASAVESSDELTGFRLSLLRIQVLISAAQIANSTMEEATEVSKELRGLLSNSSMQPSKLHLLLYSVSELESMLTQNYWEARTAVALEDRIKAAGQMQDLTFSLRHIFYLLKKQQLP